MKNSVKAGFLLLAAVAGIGFVEYRHYDAAASFVREGRLGQVNGVESSSMVVINPVTTAGQGPANASSVKEAAPSISIEVKASIQVGGKSYQMQANSLNGAISSFSPLSLSPKQRVHVAMSYPQVEASQMVVLETEDGGLIDGKVPAKIVRSDAAGNLAFDFIAGADVGQNRIVLRTGASQAVIHFTIEPSSVN